MPIKKIPKYIFSVVSLVGEGLSFTPKANSITCMNASPILCISSQFTYNTLIEITHFNEK